MTYASTLFCYKWYVFGCLDIITIKFPIIVLDDVSSSDDNTLHYRKLSQTFTHKSIIDNISPLGAVHILRQPPEGGEGG